jgi:hypothetical protein
MRKAAGHQTLDSFLLLLVSSSLVLVEAGRILFFFCSIVRFSLLIRMQDWNRVVQERLRRDSATTCAHCFSLIFTVSGGSSADTGHGQSQTKIPIAKNTAD